MVGGEDPDLSQRLIERGYYLKVSDKAIILHHDRVSVRRIYKTLKSYGYGNRMRADMGNIPFEDWSFIIGVQVFMRQSLIYRQRRDIKLSQKVYWFFLHLAYLVGYTSGYKKSIDANASQSPVIQSNNSSGLMPMVSVVIPCFNDGQYLIEAIESVESFPDLRIYEIILVDDGSTNSQTLTVYEQVEKKGHQVLRPGKIGKCQARNLGIRQAKAKYILALDADNKIKWTYLRKAIYAMEKDSRLGVVYGNAEFFGDKTGYNKTRAFDIRRMFFSNYIDTCAVFRKKVWEDVGGFDEEMPLQHREDWDFWLGAFSKGWQFCYLDEPMFYYRVRENAQGKIGDKEENRKVIESYVTAKYADMFREEFREMYMELDLIKNSKWILLRRVIIFPFEILRHFFGKKN
jgi:glycosyltransferase involved in cell wall biosynthesis